MTRVDPDSAFANTGKAYQSDRWELSPSAHTRKASSDLKLRRKRCGAAVFSSRARSCSPRTSPTVLTEKRWRATKKTEKSNSKRCIATAKIVGAGNEKESEGPEGSVRGVGPCSDSTSRIVRFATSRFPTQGRSHLIYLCHILSN